MRALLGFGLFAISSLIAAAAAGAPPPAVKAAALADGQHDFDWEIGTWKTHLKRRLRPLTGSTEWVEYEGTSVVTPVWDGRANLVELDVSGPAGRIEGLALRLYNPQTHQWSLNFSNSAGGTLAKPTIGSFDGSRGEFYNEETLGDRAIFVRFVITKTSADSATFEQAFSADGGKTWEVNWIATDMRVKSGR
ncbi:MAG TPA: hypothetical protein VF033_02565 [Steroidobacteraceae bacterium]